MNISDILLRIFCSSTQKCEILQLNENMHDLHVNHYSTLDTQTKIKKIMDYFGLKMVHFAIYSTNLFKTRTTVKIIVQYRVLLQENYVVEKRFYARIVVLSKSIFMLLYKHYKTIKCSYSISAQSPM